MTDSTIALSEAQKSQLLTYLETPKFAPDEDYVGYLSYDVVPDPESTINAIAHEILKKGSYSKGSFLESMGKQLKILRLADTEDRERAAAGIEKLMDILGIESSDGKLNEAVYGFPL